MTSKLASAHLVSGQASGFIIWLCPRLGRTQETCQVGRRPLEHSSISISCISRSYATLQYSDSLLLGRCSQPNTSQHSPTPATNQEKLLFNSGAQNQCCSSFNISTRLEKLLQPWFHRKSIIQDASTPHCNISNLFHSLYSHKSLHWCYMCFTQQPPYNTGYVTASGAELQ